MLDLYAINVVKMSKEETKDLMKRAFRMDENQLTDFISLQEKETDFMEKMICPKHIIDSQKTFVHNLRGIYQCKLGMKQSLEWYKDSREQYEKLKKDLLK